MPVNIHGRQYITVAERVQGAHAELKTISITTEVLFQAPVVVKATVVTPKGTFTGISAANPAKAIEKLSPYEVAETSAVGRALGFAGYGIVEGIASADEINKADTDPQWVKDEEPTVGRKCPVHNIPLLRGVSKTKFTKDGSPKVYWYHMAGPVMCFGNEVVKHEDIADGLNE